METARRYCTNVGINLYCAFLAPHDDLTRKFNRKTFSDGGLLQDKPILITATRGVGSFFEWGDERRRREKRGAEGAEGGRVRGGGLLRRMRGLWRGLCPLPRKIWII